MVEKMQYSYSTIKCLKEFPRKTDFYNMFFPGEHCSNPVEGDDSFGVHWIVIPNSGQTVVYRNGPILTDICEWESQVHFPNWEQFDSYEDAEK